MIFSPSIFHPFVGAHQITEMIVVHRCELCKVFTSDGNLLAKHMSGKNHMKRLKAAGQPVA